VGIAFLLTNPYQVYHYKWIAQHLSDVTVVIEVREQDFGLSAEYVARHLPDSEIKWVSNQALSSLDGQFDVIVCQTPILLHEFLKDTLVVAQQYSLAKEQYQYGAWRSHASLNLMYGNYSVAKVEGFSTAVPVGNPLLDPYFQVGNHGLDSTRADNLVDRPILYLPTYGALSSIDTVLPYLATVQGPVTVKLHHMDDANELPALPSHIELVDSTADPVALFQTHDSVISDYSGAAFDALYAGLPVVITGSPDRTAKDYRRLSSDELRRSLLNRATAPWQPGDDLSQALQIARKKLGGSDYGQLISELFTNPGTSAAACAREIERLLESGPQVHFAAQQVRLATERYITANRGLRSQIAELSVPASSTPASDGAELSWRHLRAGIRLSLHRRARRLQDRNAFAARLFKALRGQGSSNPLALDSDDTGPPPEPTPAARREAVFQSLLPCLEKAGATVARDHDRPGADIAVQQSDKKAFHDALMELAVSRPDLHVRVGFEWSIRETLPLHQLLYYDLFNAHWLEIGSPREVSPYKIGPAGYLTVLFVDRDPDRNRIVTERRAANRVDWTPLFAEPTSANGSTAIVAIGTRPTRVSAPIDVVYTWVDSTDPNWRESHRQYSQHYDPHNQSANNEERYIDREELRYSLRSLWMYAPFVRNIYIVTADQSPRWLRANDDRITLVPHRDIFPDPSVLPTFNSHAIEACLHRIPGLSEYFLYLNDDFFLGREATEDDFFSIQGQAKVRLSPSQYIYQGKPEFSAIPTDWAAYNSINLVERDFDLSFDRRLKHLPYPLRKSTLQELEDRYSQEFTRTRASRFRAITDLAVPSMFAQYYSIATARAVEWPNIKYEYIYLDTGRTNSAERFRQILRRRPTFFCLNATRHTEIDLVTQAANVREFLSSAFPSPAPWEDINS
jgi:hypothetical protein